MALGLSRFDVQLVAHEPAWARSFALEREQLIAAAGHLLPEVEHVGSTSVPGLIAKPILDIAARVRRRDDLPGLAKLLAPLGWIDRGDKGPTGGYHLFVRESAPAVRTHHLHVVPVGEPGWADYIVFRDALRGSEALRKAYAAEKRRLAVAFVGSRRDYTAGKSDFVRRVLASEGHGSAG